MDRERLERCVGGVIGGEQIVGAGFVVRDRLFVTCWHVVQQALRHDDPRTAIGRSVGVEFVNAEERGRVVEATLRYAANHPALDRPQFDDIAILELAALPPGVEQFDGFAPIDERCDVAYFGFPEDCLLRSSRGAFLPAHAYISDGALRPLWKRGFDRHFVQPGCSGGLVVREEDRAPLGMVKMRKLENGETIEGFAIDDKTLKKALDDYRAHALMEKARSEPQAKKNDELPAKLERLSASITKERGNLFVQLRPLFCLLEAVLDILDRLRSGEELWAEDADDLADLMTELGRDDGAAAALGDGGLDAEIAAIMALLAAFASEPALDAGAGVDLDPSTDEGSKNCPAAEKIRDAALALAERRRGQPVARVLNALAGDLDPRSGHKVRFAKLDHRRRRLAALSGSGAVRDLALELQAWLGTFAHRLPPRIAFRDHAAFWAPEMVIVPAGGFWMGSPKSEPERRDNEGPRHRVDITRRFALGRFAVTFEEYDRFCEDAGARRPEDRRLGRDRRPVIDVNWEDARGYVAWLNGKLGIELYRLPSESEWEFACRAGSEKPFSFGPNISPNEVNYNGNYPYSGGAKGKYRERTVSVGELPGNEWGLFEMHGNVWEWCEDDYRPNYAGAPTDGSAWLDGNGEKVLRGGSWSSGAGVCRSATRIGGAPEDHVNNGGFRLARTVLPRKG